MVEIDRGSLFERGVIAGIFLQLCAVCAWTFLFSSIWFILGILYWPEMIFTGSDHRVMWMHFTLWTVIQVALVAGVSFVARTFSGGQRKTFVIVFLAGLVTMAASIVFFYIYPAFWFGYFWWQ